MKVIAVNGSPHENGVTAKGISVMKAELEKEGIDVEVIHAGNKIIRGCTDCRKCKKAGRCVTEDPTDTVNEVYVKMQAADGLILGCPVYYGSIAGTFKCLLDRLFFPGPKMRFKAAASVVALRRTGGLPTFQQINNYFNLAQMVITPGVYWNVMHGTNQQEALEDQEGLQIMQIQGRNMAWLIKALACGSREIPLPPDVAERKRTNFIH